VTWQTIAYGLIALALIVTASLALTRADAVTGTWAVAAAIPAAFAAWRSRARTDGSK
jgi:hypothetical protein